MLPQLHNFKAHFSLFCLISVSSVQAQRWINLDVPAAIPGNYDTDNGDPFGSLVTDVNVSDYLVGATAAEKLAMIGYTFSVSTLGPGRANELAVQQQIIARDGAEWKLSFNMPVSFQFFGNTQWGPGERVDNTGSGIITGVDDPSLTVGSSFVHNNNGPITFVTDGIAIGTDSSSTATEFGFSSSDTIPITQSTGFSPQVFVTPVPEPSTTLLLSISLVFLGRRQRK